MNLTNLKQHPRTFSRLFGLTPEQFDRFITQADPLWTESETKRLNTLQAAFAHEDLTTFQYTP